MDIFWDVDTQNDFMNADGKLYVPAAEEIKNNLRVITSLAGKKGIRVMGSIDYHHPDDPELSPAPDFQETFPPHCLAGTAGAEKISETAPRNPVWVDGAPLSENEIENILKAVEREIIFRKQRFDVFSNGNAEIILKELNPTRVFVYGVALDVCVAHAVNGMLKRGLKERIFLIEDGTKAIFPDKGKELEKRWSKEGVNLITTAELENII
jgi:nicotinamidase/pyrazinamidase